MHVNCIVLSYLLHTHTYHTQNAHLSITDETDHSEHITDDGVWLDCLHQVTSWMGIDVTLVLYTFKVPLDFLLVMFILLSPPLMVAGEQFAFFTTIRKHSIVFVHHFLQLVLVI